ncbi:MAG: protein kinase domain-containing protein, partial [Gemmataceae bacterium]
MEKLEYQHEAGSEPISGYRLLEPLGQGGFAEVWKCTAPGGLLKAIKFVHGGCHILDTNAPAEEELRAVERVKAIRHPFMLMMERVEIVRGELVIVMELADQSLADLLEVERKQGKQGIPRDPLLIYLREAAELLDVMNTHYGLQHLDIKPRNLFLVSNHVKIGDFGLVSSLSATNKDMGLGAITPLYASPEVFQGSISNQSDQYSLAIVFMELLVGKLPFTGKNARQLLLQHLTEEPDLSSLPEKDRTIIARALSKNPIDRYPSCTDLIQALILGQSEVVSSRTVFFPEIQEIQQRQNDSKRIQISRVKQLTPTQLRKLPSLNVGVEFDRMEIVDLVSKTPLTEIFRARTPDGFPRLVKILFSCPPPGDPGVRRLEEMRHPCLQPMEIMEHKPGRLVISCPVSDCNLRDVLATCHSNGYKGIPRIQLLEYLRSAAEGLQFLQKKYDLYHLSLNPRNLVLDGDRLQMAEFGILQQVWLPTGQVLGPLNPRYSAPELNQNRVNPSCDQYSLAICYHELLVGRL